MDQVSHRSAFAHCLPCPLGQLCPHGCCELPPQQAQGKPWGGVSCTELSSGWSSANPSRSQPRDNEDCTHGEHLRPSRWLLSPETTSHSVKESRGTLPVGREMHTFIDPVPKPCSALSLLKDQSRDTFGKLYFYTCNTLPPIFSLANRNTHIPIFLADSSSELSSSASSPPHHH